MSKESEEFEQKVQRIHELLERSNSSVTWNDRIPDPDNFPNQRQIDVLIKNGDLTTLVECRIHKQKQNVKWIEELIGRKESLNADAIIGVSSNGFTKGAINKAAARGVILCDLKGLSDEEVSSWSRFIKVRLFYYQFKNSHLTLFVDDLNLENIKLNNLRQELDEKHVIEHVFNHLSEFLDKENLLSHKLSHPESIQERNVTARLNINNLYLQNIPIKHLLIESDCELVAKSQLYPEVFSYGDPRNTFSARDVYIQQFKGGETEIIHNSGNVSITIDISKLNLPDLALFRFANYESSDEVNAEYFSLINPEQMRIKSESLKINIDKLSNLPTIDGYIR